MAIEPFAHAVYHYKAGPSNVHTCQDSKCAINLRRLDFTFTLSRRNPVDSQLTHGAANFARFAHDDDTIRHDVGMHVEYIPRDAIH